MGLNNNNSYEIIINESTNTEEVEVPTLKKKYNDKLFSFLFIFQILLFFIISILKIDWNKAINANVYSGQYFPNIKNQTIINLIIMVPTIIIFTIFWKMVFKKYKEKSFKFCLYQMNIVGIPLIMVLYYFKFYYQSIIMLIVFFLSAIFHFQNLDKIPIACKILSIAIEVIEKSPFKILAIGIVSLVFYCMYLNVWMFTIINYQYSYGGNGFIRFIEIAFFIFNLQWTLYFINYSSTTIISGIFATWYFHSTPDGDLPENIIFGSIQRSMTTSFGSIAFGALVIDIIGLLGLLFYIFSSIPILFKFCFNTLKSKFKRETTTTTSPTRISAGTSGTNTDEDSQIIKNIKYFFSTRSNHSLCMIAIYGDSFCESSKRTLDLVTNENYNKFLITTSHIFISLYAISLTLIITTGIISTGLLYCIIPSTININYQLIISLFCMLKPFEIIFSSITTILLCIYSNPSILQNSKTTHSINGLF